jgi:hypothetical protein
MLTTHFQRPLRIMSGAIPLLHPMPSWSGQGQLCLSPLPRSSDTLSPLQKVWLILCREVILVSCGTTQNVLSLYVVHIAALYVVHTVQGYSDISVLVTQEVSRQNSQSVCTSLSLPHSSDQPAQSNTARSSNTNSNVLPYRFNRITTGVTV